MVVKIFIQYIFIEYYANLNREKFSYCNNAFQNLEIKDKSRLTEILKIKTNNRELIKEPIQH